jgi:hypothetical protein
MKGLPTEQKKIFANYLTGLISILYKVFEKLNNRNQAIQFLKIDK